jgi:hypothetical protein
MASKEETTKYTFGHGLEPDRACRVHSATSVWRSTLHPDGQCALLLELKRPERLANTTDPFYFYFYYRCRDPTQSSPVSINLTIARVSATAGHMNCK